MVSSTSTAIPAKRCAMASVQVDALADLEHFSLDGVEYEAFNTSGGLGSLCRRWPARCATWTTSRCATPATSSA
jgi:hypothetical protein